MSKSLRRIYTSELNQETIQSCYSDVYFSQPFVFRCLLIALAYFLSALAGICAGMLNFFILRSIFFTTQPHIGLISASSILVVLLVWFVETIRNGIVSGLWKAIFLNLVMSFLAANLIANPFFSLLFFLVLVALATAFCALLSSSLASRLITTLFTKNSKLLQLCVLILCVACSIITTTAIGGGDTVNYSSFISNLSTTKLIVGIFTGFVVAQIGCLTLLKTEQLERFAFLSNWSIALASWGGTSFHDLDLSEIDFSGSRLANCDFRAHKLYRTCLKGVTGLERARVDNRYLDLDQPKVQQLLTHGYSNETDFSHVNLQGAYLQDAIMQRFDLTEANLNGADLQGADLRDSILLRSQANGVNFSGANLTGICIQDWSVNSETNFSGVQCDYVYREYRDDRPTDRYPSDRNFKPGEFESLFQKITNAVELVFQEQIDWRALSFTFEKFRVEDDGMGLELKGIEQRGDYWIVKVTHGEGVSKQLVEQQVHSTYEELRALLESKDKQINQLLGIVDNQTKAMYQQAEALTNFSKQPLGNSFFISGSTITNLAGSGQIEYTEAAHQVRSLITNQSNPNQTLQQLLTQLSQQKVAVTAATQTELIQQVILSEAERDPAFKQFLLQHQQQITNCLPSEDIAIAVQAAISALRQP